MGTVKNGISEMHVYSLEQVLWIGLPLIVLVVALLCLLRSVRK